MINGMIGSSKKVTVKVDSTTDSIAIGPDAGTLFNADDFRNIAIGANALNSTGSTASNNIAIGEDALTSCDTGDINVGIGTDALKELTTGTACIAIGYLAGDAITIGADNIAIGRNALTTSQDADRNIAIGSYSLEEYEGADAEGFNVAVGYEAGRYLSSGHRSTLIGYRAAKGVDGSEVTFHDNTCIGYNSGIALITNGSSNTFLGSYSGNTVTTGDYNTCLGYSSDAATNTAYSVAVGTSAETQNSNEIAIGYSGGWQAMSNSRSGTLGGVQALDPLHASPFFKIPAYSVIKSVSAVITTLSSSDNCTCNVLLSSDSTGSDNTNLADPTEILGASEASTHSGSSASAVDINAASGGILKQSYHSTPKVTITADRYVYVAFADANHEGGDTDPTTAPVIRVCVEYAGKD